MSRTADSFDQGHHIVKSMPRRTRVFFWILLILLAAVLSLFGGEIALRALYRDQDVTGTYWGLHAFEADDVLGYRHASGYRGRVYRSGIFDCPVEISAYGLRQAGAGPQAARALVRGTFRLVSANASNGLPKVGIGRRRARAGLWEITITS